MVGIVDTVGIEAGAGVVAHTVGTGAAVEIIVIERGRVGEIGGISTDGMETEVGGMRMTVAVGDGEEEVRGRVEVRQGKGVRKGEPELSNGTVRRRARIDGATMDLYIHIGKNHILLLLLLLVLINYYYCSS